MKQSDLDEIEHWTKAGKKIKAIKLLRSHTSLDLKAAKDYIDNWEVHGSWSVVVTDFLEENVVLRTSKQLPEFWRGRSLGRLRVMMCEDGSQRGACGMSCDECVLYASNDDKDLLIKLIDLLEE